MTQCGLIGIKGHRFCPALIDIVFPYWPIGAWPKGDTATQILIKILTFSYLTKK